MKSDTSGMIESFKWLGLIAMVVEHWMRFVVGEVPDWVYQVGRIAFPLFVLSLALGLRRQPLPKFWAVTKRMLVWALIAQACLQLVPAPEGQLNVLFTFTLGLAAVYGLSRWRPSFLLAIALCAIGVVALWCEFGPIGVAFVATAVGVARADDPPRAAWVAVAGWLVALAVPNGNHFALAAVPVALLVWRLDVSVPRLRGAFYWIYALQFPAYAAVRQWLV